MGSKLDSFVCKNQKTTFLTSVKFKKVKFAQECLYTAKKMNVNMKTKCSPTSAL